MKYLGSERKRRGVRVLRCRTHQRGSACSWLHWHCSPRSQLTMRFQQQCAEARPMRRSRCGVTAAPGVAVLHVSGTTRGSRGHTGGRGARAGPCATTHARANVDTCHASKRCSPQTVIPFCFLCQACLTLRCCCAPAAAATSCMTRTTRSSRPAAAGGACRPRRTRPRAAAATTRRCRSAPSSAGRS